MKSNTQFAKKIKQTLPFNVKLMLKNSAILLKVNSEKKNEIGNLSFKNSIGIEETTNNDNTKAEILNNFFTGVFVKEDNTEFTRLNHIPNIPNMDLPMSTKRIY